MSSGRRAPLKACHFGRFCHTYCPSWDGGQRWGEDEDEGGGKGRGRKVDGTARWPRAVRVGARGGKRCALHMLFAWPAVH